MNERSCENTVVQTGHPYKIYKYTNTINGMIYIGQTCKTLEDRAAGGANYKGSRRFYNAILKYGWKSFASEILEDNLTQEMADEREQYYISKFDSTNPSVGYNIQPGGRVALLSKESRMIISEKAKIRYKDKTKNPMYGRKHSEESKEKMKRNSPHLSGEHNPNFGNKYTNERLERMSESAKRWRRDHPLEAIELNAKNANRLRITKPAAKKIRCIETGEKWESMTACANAIGVRLCCVCDQIKGRQKTCKGLHFEIVNDEV